MRNLGGAIVELVLHTRSRKLSHIPPLYANAFSRRIRSKLEFNQKKKTIIAHKNEGVELIQFLLDFFKLFYRWMV